MSEGSPLAGHQAELARSPFSGFVGNRLEERRPGYARLSLQVGPQHLDFWGRLHPGVLATMMDSALGAAMRQPPGTRGRERRRATIALDMCVWQAVGEGEELVVEGRLVERWGEVAFGEAEVRRADGGLVARGSLVFALGGERG